MSETADDIQGAEGESVLPPRERMLATLVVMAATIMVVLDTTIANVAIPHMRAALGATSESVAWVLTSYIVATAIAIPLTGWLADLMGRRMLFTIAIVGFTISSMLCGAAQSLPMMIAARVLQGVFGAFISPLSQATMYDINPREKHAQAMMIWGVGVMLAPVMGPVLGGWLTEQYDWRWVFYINVPIGVATAAGALTVIPNVRGRPRGFDMFGFVLLAAGLAGLQLMLDRGTQLDWFESTEIWIEAAVAVAAVWMLVLHLWGSRSPILPRALFRDRNFVTALMFMTLMGGIIVAGSALVAPMLQQLMGYPVFEAGLTIAPRGFGTLIGFILAGRSLKWIDARLLIASGIVLVAWSLHMMTGFELGMGSDLVLVSGFVQGVGVGLVMMPMNLLAFATLPPQLRTDAASLYNLLRNIGGSVAIAVTTALLASNLQVNHAELGARVAGSALAAGFTESAGFDSRQIWAMVDVEVNRQASMIAYVDDYWLMMWLVILASPLVLLLTRPAMTGEPVHVGE